MEDSLFEKLPNELAKEFPLQFLEAMPVGVDKNIIFKKFMIWNLTDKKEGLLYHIKNKKYIDLLKEISDTYKKSFKIEIPIETWQDLAKRASAYASAYAYAYASPEWQKRFDERILKMRDKLLKLIKAAK